MNITITTTAKTDEEATALLTSFSFPFRKPVAEVQVDTAALVEETQQGEK